jgi:ProP effector
MPEVAAADLNVALSIYTSDPRYLRACSDGAERIGLDGVVGDGDIVEANQAAHAGQVLDKIKARRRRRLDKLQPPPPPPTRITLSDLRAAAAQRRREGATS